MKDLFVNFINYSTEILWGPFMLVLLLGGGIFLSIRLKFIQITHFKYMFSQTMGTIFKKSKDQAQSGEGTLTPFQAMTTALASTVGAANIVGVPVAIYFGGPGAVFWMWVTAIFGMVTMYSEVVLGIVFRGKNEDGEYVGGPMYYLKNGLKSKFLGSSYALLFMLTIVSGIMVQANSAAGSAVSLGLDKNISGIIITLIVGIIVVGGVSRIGKISEKLVPIMSLLYCAGCLIIVMANITSIPSIIVQIFKGAFTAQAAAGGFAGSTIALAMRWGIARGAYSNEAGMGSAPIAHSTAKTDHAVRQGFWGMITVFLDTVVICTMTGFVVLITDIWKVPGIEASAMTAEAFKGFYGPIGSILVSLSVLLFVISTIYVILFYGEKLAEYLFGKKFALVMRYIYLAACFIGAIGGMQFLWIFLDFLFGLSVIPNMIGVIGLSGVVVAKTKEFFNSEEYYLKDINSRKKSIS